MNNKHTEKYLSDFLLKEKKKKQKNEKESSKEYTLWLYITHITYSTLKMGLLSLLLFDLLNGTLYCIFKHNNALFLIGHGETYGLSYISASSNDSLLMSFVRMILWSFHIIKSRYCARRLTYRSGIQVASDFLNHAKDCPLIILRTIAFREEPCQVAKFCE